MQESFPEFKDMSSQMKREDPVLRTMNGKKMSHTYNCEISEHERWKDSKSFQREMGEKTAHVQWKSEWQTFQKQAWQLEANGGGPSKFQDNNLECSHYFNQTWEENTVICKHVRSYFF